MMSIWDSQLELSSLRYRIEDLEFKRLRDLADESMQIELIGLLRQQHNAAQRLRETQMRIMEEDVLLLMSLPFNA